MNILLIVTKGEIGGAQIAVLNLAKKLKSSGHGVVVGFGQGDYLKAELENFSIPAVRFKWLKRTHNPLANALFILEIRKFLNDPSSSQVELPSNQRFDIVHLNSSNALCGGLGAKLSRSKPRTVFTFHGLSMLDNNYQKNKLSSLAYIRYFRFFLGYVDKPVFVCNRDLQKSIDSGLTATGTVIYNGVEISEADFLIDGNARYDLGKILDTKLDDRFLIGSIGRLAYPKNYEFIIKVFPKLLKIRPDLALILIGKGPEDRKYKQLVKESGMEKNIFLTGVIKDAYRYIKAFSLFVLPSVFEGFSITLIEALCAGVPVLTTKVGGSPELLDNDESQLYTLNDEHEFMDKAARIIKDTQLAESIKNKNQISSKKYSLDLSVKKHLDCYQN